MSSLFDLISVSVHHIGQQSIFLYLLKSFTMKRASCINKEQCKLHVFYVQN